MPPRILHVITGLNVGGAELQLAGLLRVARSRQSGVESLVIALSDEGPIAAQIRASGSGVACLGMRPGSVNPFAVGRLMKLAREFRPDLIQTWMYHADLLGGWVGVRLHVPVVWGIRRSDVPKFGSPWRANGLGKKSTALVAGMCARLSYRLPERIVCNSKTGHTAHAACGYDAGRMLVIHNGIDCERFKPDPIARNSLRRELGLDDHALAIGMVGRADRIKDPENFIAAAGQVARLRNDIRFVLVGRGLSAQEGRVQQAVQRTGYGSRFMILEERHDIPAVMSALDLFCLPSISEGFPNVLAEAMACGVPSVTTDAGDAAMIANGCGIVVPPRDPGALAAALSRVLSLSEPERRQMGADGRARIVEKFSMERAWAEYQTLYTEVLAAGTPPLAS